jgi:hypothetical protein
MQAQTPPSGKPMTVRGADGKPHLASEMKGKSVPMPPRRIRPIVPNIFRAPD